MREQNTPQGCIFSVFEFLLAVTTWLEQKLSFPLSNVDPLNRSATHNFPHARHRSLVLLSTVRPVRLAKLHSAAVSRLQDRNLRIFFSFGATAPMWALAYLHETLRFTSVY
jgi:hypothetical protein